MTMRCRFCGAQAVVQVALSRGCTCYPEDREQWLCAQHEQRSEPLGTWRVLAEVAS